MIRRRSSDTPEVASIIQEIVIYDKPNKPTVPAAILPQSRKVKIGQGDIIIKGTPIKDEPQEISESEEEIKKESCINDTIDIHQISSDKSNDSNSREVLKLSSKKKQGDGNSKGSPFKKPGAKTMARRNSILDYLPQNDAIEITEKHTLNEEARQKRVRRMPKKFQDDDIILNRRSLGRYSSEEPDIPMALPLKKKKYAELTIVPIYNSETASNQDSGNEEQSEEINDLVSSEESRVDIFTKHSLGKNSKLASSKKTKTKKSIINSDAEGDMQLVQDEMYNLSSDEDSRKEWVPEEYAEYKRLHNLKQKSIEPQRANSKVHKCKFCSLEFDSYYSLRKHRALQHDDLGKNQKESNPDEQISEASDEENSQGEWMPEDYAEYKIKHTINKHKRMQWYKCKICCSVFSNYYKLSKHRVEHERQEPYDCKHCNSKFKDVESFSAHLRMHQGKSPYICRKCCKGFDTKEELQAHEPIHVLKKAPIAEKRYRCEICGKDFRKICDIERHTRVHTGEKPAECNICHKRFQQVHNLSKHLLTHLHVRPFQCQICNKKFGRIDVLNRHLLTHSVEKPYKCNTCGKGFIRQVQFNNHMDKNHTDELEAASVVSVTDEVMITALG
ncbi:uncharacterized protein [Euwallacea fornicatus]|uniref:uncharacterized protein n=1 Tax=Euwallacea fornicatus TaxID=995702 RepID=UPI00338D87F8